MTVLDKLLDKIVVDLVTDCWIWTASKVEGYGRIGVSGSSVLVYKLIYEILIGPVPYGLELDHLCTNRACCNPWHMEPVTRRVNILRGNSAAAINARKTHCPEGHPLSGDNVYRKPGTGWRDCRKCINARARRRRAAA